MLHFVCLQLLTLGRQRAFLTSELLFLPPPPFQKNLELRTTPASPAGGGREGNFCSKLWRSIPNFQWKLFLWRNWEGGWEPGCNFLASRMHLCPTKILYQCCNDQDLWKQRVKPKAEIRPRPFDPITETMSKFLKDGHMCPGQMWVGVNYPNFSDLFVIQTGIGCQPAANVFCLETPCGPEERLWLRLAGNAELCGALGRVLALPFRDMLDESDAILRHNNQLPGLCGGWQQTVPSRPDLFCYSNYPIACSRLIWSTGASRDSRCRGPHQIRGQEGFRGGGGFDGDLGLKRMGNLWQDDGQLTPPKISTCAEPSQSKANG